MILNNRRTEMMEYIKQNRRVTVKKLAQKFYVSEMTIRRDLKELENQGYIQRFSGGAVYLEEYQSLPIESRSLLYTAEKRKISEKAKKHLCDFMTVFIDSSSTALYVIPDIAEYKDVTIVTNSVKCLIAASEYHIKCIMAGGSYFEHDMCTIGGAATEFLSGINVDVGFFSASALSENGIISDNNEAQTAVRRAMLKNCEKKIFLFDSTKLNKKHLYTVCLADDADDIIVV